MQVFRKKILILFATGIAVLALLNASVGIGNIIECFHGININYLLVEELPETAEGETENSSESMFEIEFFLSRENHSFLIKSFSKSVGIVIHSMVIPIHPLLEAVTPPPKR